MGGAGREGVESPCPLTSIRPWEKWPIFEGSFNQLAARTRAKIRRRKETSRSEREIIQSEEKKEKKEEILLPSPWHGGAQVWKATSKATAANWIYNELVSPWTKFRVAACLPAEHPRPHACLLRPDALDELAVGQASDLSWFFVLPTHGTSKRRTRTILITITCNLIV